jgi:hypothetical protein
MLLLFEKTKTVPLLDCSRFNLGRRQGKRTYPASSGGGAALEGEALLLLPGDSPRRTCESVGRHCPARSARPRRKNPDAPSFLLARGKSRASENRMDFFSREARPRPATP